MAYLVVPDAELANTLHKADALHATGDLFRRNLVDENDTKNERSVEMEIAMEEDPYFDDVSYEDTLDEPWFGEADEFEARDTTNPVPKELASKRNVQIDRFLALGRAYGTASARDLQKASNSRS